MIRSNFHTHTIYCDGKNTPEEMIKKAISLGFSSLGFSGHGYTPFDNSFCMSKENTKKYSEAIQTLCEKYKDKIEIYCGTEADLYSEFDQSKYDYIIGSVHYVKAGNEYLSVDDSEEITKKIVTNYFDNDFLKYTRAYYETTAQLPQINPDIIGHFDVVSKFNEGGKFFDETDARYLEPAFLAIDEIIKKCSIFEINTGAVAKGYKKAPYPLIPILKRLKEKGAKIILSSDCHDLNYLDFYFEESKVLLKEIGFHEAVTISGRNFLEYSI